MLLDSNYSSVCNRNIVSGTYDMGDNPRVEFYVGDNGRYLFMEMHDGINEDMKDVKAVTGLSRFYDGIVVDSWDVGDVDVKRENVFRLCVGLKLSIDEAEELMESAGLCFRNGDMLDTVIKANIVNECYDTFYIDCELCENKVPTLFALA